MNEDLKRLSNIVEAVGRRPGMFVGRTDDVFAVSTYLSGLFMGGGVKLYDDFREWVREQYGEEEVAGFAQLERAFRDQDPEISDGRIIAKIGEVTRDFLVDRIENGENA